MPMAASAEVVEYPPATPTLFSDLGTECVNDTVQINYAVELEDPGNVVTNDAATIVLSRNGNSVRLPLGTLVNGVLSGTVTWPTAVWARGDITAVVEVNPVTEAVVLEYPAATAECVGVPTTTTTTTTTSTGTPSTQSGTGLAVTGMDEAAVPIALGVGGVLLAGGLLLVAARRRITER